MKLEFLFSKAKPMCMYGSKCYQKSGKHSETFIHDEASKDGGRKDDMVNHEKFQLNAFNALTGR